MKDMSSVYWNMARKDLRKLRSKKYNRRERLRSKRGLSYLDSQELRILNEQIKRIDAIIHAQEEQLGYET